MPKNKGNRRAIQAPVRPAPVVRLAPVVRHPGFPYIKLQVVIARGALIYRGMN